MKLLGHKFQNFLATIHKVRKSNRTLKLIWGGGGGGGCVTVYGDLFICHFSNGL